MTKRYASKDYMSKDGHRVTMTLVPAPCNVCGFWSMHEYTFTRGQLIVHCTHCEDAYTHADTLANANAVVSFAISLAKSTGQRSPEALRLRSPGDHIAVQAHGEKG